MPLLLRHLAVALLPIASTTAGIVAVGIALQLPTGPPVRVAVPVDVRPVAAAPPVVARRVPRPKPQAVPAAPRSRGALASTPAPPRAQRIEAPAVVVASGPTPEPPRRVLLPEDPAPITPPMAPEPMPEPAPATEPATEPVAEPVAAITPAIESAPVAVVAVQAVDRRQKGKRATKAQKRPHHVPGPKSGAVVGVLSTEPAPAGAGEATDGPGREGMKDRPGDRKDDVANAGAHTPSDTATGGAGPPTERGRSEDEEDGRGKAGHGRGKGGKPGE